MKRQAFKEKYHTRRHKALSRYARLFILLFLAALLMGGVTRSAHARPTPTESAAVSPLAQAGRRDLSDMEKLAALFVGSLSLGASVLHRFRAVRRRV
jgi:hypothetical protein